MSLFSQLTYELILSTYTWAYSLNLQTTGTGGIHIDDLRNRFRDSVFRFINFPHCYAISAEGARCDVQLKIEMSENDGGTAFLDLII